MFYLAFPLAFSGRSQGEPDLTGAKGRWDKALFVISAPEIKGHLNLYRSWSAAHVLRHILPIPTAALKKNKDWQQGSFLFFSPALFFWLAVKGSTKIRTPERENRREDILWEFGQKKKKKKNQNYELHFKSVSLRIFDVCKFNVVLHFFYPLFFRLF